jgi:hypothetical protein
MYLKKTDALTKKRKGKGKRKRKYMHLLDILMCIFR